MNNTKLILHIMSDKNIVSKAIKIALIVGVILNLINQGEYLIHLDFANINFFKLGFTFLVPFCVSTYTAISMKMKYHVGEKAILSAILICNKCKQTHDVQKDETIPFCHNCQDKTSWKIQKIKECNVYSRN